MDRTKRHWYLCICAPMLSPPPRRNLLPLPLDPCPWPDDSRLPRPPIELSGIAFSPTLFSRSGSTTAALDAHIGVDGCDGGVGGVAWSAEIALCSSSACFCGLSGPSLLACTTSSPTHGRLIAARPSDPGWNSIALSCESVLFPWPIVPLGDSFN